MDAANNTEIIQVQSRYIETLEKSNRELIQLSQMILSYNKKITELNQTLLDAITGKLDEDE